MTTLKTLAVFLSLALAAAVCTPSEAWIVVGTRLVSCGPDGCTGAYVYWTGTDSQYANNLPKAWSKNRKDAKQYPAGKDAYESIPNGQHCCYVEDLWRVDPQTLEFLGYGPSSLKGAL